MSDFPEVTEHQWPGHSPPPNLWPSASSAVQGTPAPIQTPPGPPLPSVPRSSPHHRPSNLNQGPGGTPHPSLAAFPFSPPETQGEADTGVTQVCRWDLEVAEEHLEGPEPTPRGREGATVQLAPVGRGQGGGPEGRLRPLRASSGPAAGYKAAAPTGSTAANRCVRNSGEHRLRAERVVQR